MNPNSAGSKKFPLIAVLAVIVIALLIRVNALWLPHWRGDQAQYVILSMKLTHFGLDGYNLRRASLGHLNVSPSEKNRIEFNAVKPGVDDSPGAYLALMKSIGQAYYDEPLHIRAPLFPAILALSHKIFAGRPDHPFLVLSYGPKTFPHALESWHIWKQQLWATLVPLVFNSGTIFLTAVLAWILFGSRRIAVGAAGVMAFNPLSIWLAHKILTEDTAAFFVVASMSALAVLWRRNRAAAGLAAGALAGAAVLVNQRVGLIVPAAFAFITICRWQDLSEGHGSMGRFGAWAAKITRLAVEPFFWLYTAGFAAISGFWFWRMIKTYGHPLYQPTQQMSMALQSDITGWFAAVNSRPHPFVLFSIGVLALCPLFVFSLGSWNRCWDGWTGRKKDSETRSLSLLWIWAAVFFLFMTRLTHLFSTGLQEHRYFFPAYPALAILAAFGLDRFYAWLHKIFPRQNVWPAGIVIAFFVLSAVWGCWLAYPKIFGDQMLF